MSTLTLDTPVSLFEPATARAGSAGPPRPGAPRPHPRGAARAAQHGRARGRRPAPRAPARALGRLDPLARPRAARRPAGWSPCAPSASPWRPPRSRSPLAGKGAGDAAALVASLSVRGPRRRGRSSARPGASRTVPGSAPSQTARAWYGTASVLGAAHAAWFVATMPGAAQAHLGLVARARSRWTPCSSPSPPCWALGPAGRTWTDDRLSIAPDGADARKAPRRSARANDATGPSSVRAEGLRREAQLARRRPRGARGAADRPGRCRRRRRPAGVSTRTRVAVADLAGEQRPGQPVADRASAPAGAAAARRTTGS